MKLFRGPGARRELSYWMSEAARAAEEGILDYSELAVLCNVLRRNGVEHQHQESGPFLRITFECPHGTVKATMGPGTDGFDEGLIEAVCEGWDMSPRGRLTARQVYMDYMHGGW